MVLEFSLLIAAALCSFAVGFPVYYWLTHLKVMDVPNARSNHGRPTTRGGGIAIMISILLGTVFLTFFKQRFDLAALVMVVFALGGVSLIDDIRTLPTTLRFISHILAALVLLALLDWPAVEIELYSGYSFQITAPVGWMLIVLWLVGYTNAFNFMDGINGIAAGQAAITAIGTALLAQLGGVDPWGLPVLFGFIVAGSALGFLPHNFPKARMFMGDVGSTSLGLTLASMAIWIALKGGEKLMIPLVLLHANFLLDTSATLLRRIWRGEKWYEAHREHFYQRLVRSGKSHAFVTNWEMALQALVVVMLMIYMGLGLAGRITLMVLIPLVWLSFFLYCDIQFRKSEQTRAIRRSAHEAITEVKISTSQS